MLYLCPFSECGIVLFRDETDHAVQVLDHLRLHTATRSAPSSATHSESSEQNTQDSSFHSQPTTEDSSSDSEEDTHKYPVTYTFRSKKPATKKPPVPTTAKPPATARNQTIPRSQPDNQVPCTPLPRYLQELEFANVDIFAPRSSRQSKSKQNAAPEGPTTVTEHRVARAPVRTNTTHKKTARESPPNLQVKQEYTTKLKVLLRAPEKNETTTTKKHGKGGKAKRNGKKQKGKSQGTYEQASRRFMCKEKGCGARLSTAWNLKVHMFRHTGEQPFVCRGKGCNATFSDPSCKRKHEVKAHGM